VILARHWATAAVSLVVAGASTVGGCDIDGITPKCSDAGECFTAPGTFGAGGSGNGGEGGEAGAGGTGGSAGGNTTGGNAGSGASGGNAGSAGSAGTAGSAGRSGAAGSAGAGGTVDGGSGDANSNDVTPDRRADTGPDTLPDAALADIRTDAESGAD
jgi:hypothetical protein